MKEAKYSVGDVVYHCLPSGKISEAKIESIHSYFNKTSYKVDSGKYLNEYDIYESRSLCIDAFIEKKENLIKKSQDSILKAQKAIEKARRNK